MPWGKIPILRIACAICPNNFFWYKLLAKKIVLPIRRQADSKAFGAASPPEPPAFRFSASANPETLYRLIR
jgi:hypothetical protein